jgi:antitoxin component of MazEF toxin-antitoxin module
VGGQSRLQPLALGGLSMVAQCLAHASCRSVQDVITMKARLVRIGNSRRIRLPKAIIDQVGLNDEVELLVQDQRLVVVPATRGLGDRHPEVVGETLPAAVVGPEAVTNEPEVLPPRGAGTACMSRCRYARRPR